MENHPVVFTAKRSSQAKWLSNDSNRDYFKGQSNVDRVRRWRAENPDYWRRKKTVNKPPCTEDPPTPIPQPVVVETPPSQPLASLQQENGVALQDPLTRALQDLLKSYPPFIVGLISVTLGSALQENIVRFLHSMTARGEEILRHGAAASPVPL